MTFYEYCQDDLELELKEFFKKGNKKILFGAGNQARVMSDCSKMFGINIDALMTSKECVVEEKFIDKIPCYTIKSLPKDLCENADVLIAVNEKNNSIIEKMLLDNGFVGRIYKSNNWNKTNKLLRTRYFDYIMEKHNIKVDKAIVDINGMRFFDYTQLDNMYQNSMLSEIVDLVYPILGEYDSCVEGSYENGRVIVEEGDVVIDAGANVGLFSAYASSKGAIVYSFEPNKEVAKILRKVSELNNGFQIIDKALSDKKGIGLLGYNQSASTMGRIIEMNNSQNEIIQEIAITSIDELVENNVIEKVDFIKADIEGSERDMLRGAKETLKKFGPKISICTYHLPDDREVLTKIILDANNEYKIEYGEHKLYAYIP